MTTPSTLQTPAQKAAQLRDATTLRTLNAEKNRQQASIERSARTFAHRRAQSAAAAGIHRTEAADRD